MARIDYADPQTLPTDISDALAKMAPLNIFRMVAHGTQVMLPFTRFGGALLGKTKLDPILRELAIVRVGVLSGAAYEVHQHDRISRNIGISDAKLAGLRIGPDAEIFSDLERAVLAYTDDLVANVRAGDQTFNRIVGQLGVEQAVELTLVIGYYMMVSRFLETFGVDIEEAPVNLSNFGR